LANRTTSSRNPQGRTSQWGIVGCVVLIVIALAIAVWAVKVVLYDTVKHGLNQTVPRGENSSFPNSTQDVAHVPGREELRCSSGLVLC